MKNDEFTLTSAEETRALGAQIAGRLAAGDLVLLSGPLGAGKTTLVQGLGAALGITESMSSPTFVLINEYPGEVPLLHLDAYRLEDADAEMLMDAGIFDFLARMDAIKLVEWPEMLAGWLPAAKMAIELSILENGGRLVRVTENG